jgi:hypothetical protein
VEVIFEVLLVRFDCDTRTVAVVGVLHVDRMLWEA